MKPLQRLPDFPEQGEVDEALIEGVLGSDLTRARDLAGHRVMMRAKPRAGVDAGNSGVGSASAIAILRQASATCARAAFRRAAATPLL